MMTHTKRNSRFWGVLAVAGLVMGLSGCLHEKPNVVYMPDMMYSPAFKAQEEGSMKPLPKGTVPRGFVAYQYADMDAVQAGRANINPIPRTKANLLRGQQLFNTYCIVCHGPYGEGDGYVVPKFPRPPSLQSDKIRGYADGSIYHVITMGQNLMSSYASQIAQEDRWKVVHYIRALHKARNPSPDDLKAFEESEKQ